MSSMTQMPRKVGLTATERNRNFTAQAVLLLNKKQFTNIQLGLYVLYMWNPIARVAVSKISTYDHVPPKAMMLSYTVILSVTQMKVSA